ncbi:unnamed protein product [Didymodactylos carnosus]|uniref:HEAT repeat domain-containing protein n=1 Tax=Didymodactylos carnosus TaxID=1234261 RepID=A0A8S2PRG8_9BILA|nr:unnamed protein product [Didymodactylos carnosus]CAF4068167.1 unnamed protein product [Didymodactylos carnosus]
MEKSSLILDKTLIEKELRKVSPKRPSELRKKLLNIGVVKSLTADDDSTNVEAAKDYYFIHLSFQERFAARYLVNARQNPKRKCYTKAINFIQFQKYNQRFLLVFTFTSGLLSGNDSLSCLETFAKAMTSEPLDLIGPRHMQLVIRCLEEAGTDRRIPQRNLWIQHISKWVECAANDTRDHKPFSSLIVSLRQSPLVLCENIIIDTVIRLLRTEDDRVRVRTSIIITDLDINPVLHDFIKALLTALRDKEYSVRQNVAEALGRMHGGAITPDVINGLLVALRDENNDVRCCAVGALAKLGGRAVTPGVVKGLLAALGDKDHLVSQNAAQALAKLGGGAVAPDVINGLLVTLNGNSHFVKENAAQALVELGCVAVAPAVINRLLAAVGD